MSSKSKSEKYPSTSSTSAASSRRQTSKPAARPLSSGSRGRPEGGEAESGRGGRVKGFRPRVRFRRAADVVVDQIKDSKNRKAPVIRLSPHPEEPDEDPGEAPAPLGARRNSRAATRRMSLASVVGLVLFKKMYNAELDTHARRLLRNGPGGPPAPMSPDSEGWESSDSEADEPQDGDSSARRDRRPRTEKNDMSTMSVESKMAMLRCYDDKLKSDIVKQYPHYKDYLYRTKTPSVDDSRGKEAASSAGALAETEYTSTGAAAASKQLKRAGKLVDAMKVEKGDHITTKKYLKPGDPRPKSRRLVKKYNSWTNSWARDDGEGSS